jgi:hypothetical protein
MASLLFGRLLLCFLGPTCSRLQPVRDRRRRIDRTSLRGRGGFVEPIPLAKCERELANVPARPPAGHGSRIDRRFGSDDAVRPILRRGRSRTALNETGIFAITRWSTQRTHIFDSNTRATRADEPPAWNALFSAIPRRNGRRYLMFTPEQRERTNRRHGMLFSALSLVATDVGI